MPRLLRVFAYLFIAFPGALAWLSGACLTIGGISAAIRGISKDEPLVPAIVIGMGAGSMIIGHLMVIFTRILCKDPREKFAGHRQPLRAAWELGIQAAGILIAATGISSVHCALSRNWGLLLLSIALLASSIIFYYWIAERWNKRRHLWFKELEGTQPSYIPPPGDQ